jgi:hypothetical protein
MDTGRLLLAARGIPATAEALAGASIEAEVMMLQRVYFLGMCR